jgi:uncharacterized cupin superfamily protein
VPNIHEPEWDAQRDVPPYTWSRAQLGRQAGSRDLGASLFEVPAGASSFPIHIHHHNEELLVVLQGTPTLRTLDGERVLATGEVVAFPAGRGGAHAIDNRGDTTARWLVVSTMRSPEINEFPEAGTFWVRDYAPGGPAPEGALDVADLRPPE